MINPYEIRKDFPMYDKHDGKFENKNLVYLDNCATTFKPYCVINKENEYLNDFTANTRRGDYSLTVRADKAFDEARKKVADFINADFDCVCFTSGDTFALNQVAYGLMNQLSMGDEIVLSLAEHASNYLPWLDVSKKTGAVIKFVPFDKEGRITIDNFKSVLSSKTKIVSLATVSNVLGYTLPVKELVKLTHSVNAIYVDDGAQSVPHMKYDVKDLDVDFLCFSGHKMMASTGIGVMYGKKKMLEKLSPFCYGGEMNARFNSSGYLSLDDVPYRFEAGTQNIAGAISLGEACSYLSKFDFNDIHSHEMELRKLAIEGLKANGNAIIYNENADNGIITFNIKNVFGQDVATHLSTKGVFVRSGTHCAKMLPEFLHTDGTVRASIYIYNTKEDIEAFIKACQTAEDFLDAFFN